MTPPSGPAGALFGVRVLDLSRVLAGPLCTMILGDLGAEVIKVERPGTGDETRAWGPPWSRGEAGRESAYYLSINRNKRSLAADFTVEADRELVRALAGEADVLVENYAPGTLARWGLDYESLAGTNPGLVYCSITGYGTTGPEAGRPGYDFAVQARAGWMSITGEPAGEPVKVGVAVVDVLTGQNAAIGILGALVERATSGVGQRLEVSLYDSAIAGLVNVAQAALVGAPVRRYGNAHATIVPYQAFPTADGRIVVAVGNDEQWRRFCRAAGLDGLALDPRYARNPDRVERREELVATIAARMAERGTTAWMAALDEAGVPCSPVQTVEQAVRDPALRERNGVWETSGATLGTVETAASPIRLDRTPAALRRPPPFLGEHTADVRENGWS